jgi:hypothetical protein
VEFRPIAGLEGRYSVSDVGAVRNDRTGRILKPVPAGGGYLAVSLAPAGGRQRTRPIHLLVADAFLPARPPGCEPNHKDGIKSNNAAGNLEWVTEAENTQHAYMLGLAVAPKGEAHGRSKLTEAAVRAIRSSSESGPILAQRYGVTASIIGKVRRGDIWKHV